MGRLSHPHTTPLAMAGRHYDILTCSPWHQTYIAIHCLDHHCASLLTLHANKTNYKPTEFDMQPWRWQTKYKGMECFTDLIWQCWWWWWQGPGQQQASRPSNHPHRLSITLESPAFQPWRCLDLVLPRSPARCPATGTGRRVNEEKLAIPLLLRVILFQVHLLLCLYILPETDATYGTN